MNRYEKDEIRNLPSQYRPMGAWSYWGYSILFAIPIIGFIALIVCACSSSNIVRRSYARSYFCSLLILLIVGAIVIGIGLATGGFDQLMQMIQQAMPQ